MNASSNRGTRPATPIAAPRFHVNFSAHPAPGADVLRQAIEFPVLPGPQGCVVYGRLPGIIPDELSESRKALRPSIGSRPSVHVFVPGYTARVPRNQSASQDATLRQQCLRAQGNEENAYGTANKAGGRNDGKREVRGIAQDHLSGRADADEKQSLRQDTDKGRSCIRPHANPGETEQVVIHGTGYGRGDPQQTDDLPSLVVDGPHDGLRYGPSLDSAMKIRSAEVTRGQKGENCTGRCCTEREWHRREPKSGAACHAQYGPWNKDERADDKKQGERNPGSDAYMLQPGKELDDRLGHSCTP